MSFQVVKYLFCPKCFKDRRKLQDIKCCIIKDDSVTYECTHCEAHWNKEDMKAQLEEIESQIDDLSIKSYRGKWDFMKENLNFRNKALSRLGHSLFNLRDIN